VKGNGRQGKGKGLKNGKAPLHKSKTGLQQGKPGNSPPIMFKAREVELFSKHAEEG